MKTAQDLVKEFEDSLVQNGIAPKTIESYTTDVRLFHDYIQANGVQDVTTLKRFYVMNYKQWLQDGGYAVATINKKINSLHAYNLFLIRKQYLNEQMVYPRKDRVKIANGSQKEVDVLTDEQVNRLLFHIQDRSLVTQRNELIVMMLLYTGARVSELCQIRLEDVDFLMKELSVYGKGGKHRQIPLRNDLIESIREYLKGERSQSKFADSRYLFVSQRTERLARDSVNTMLEGIAKQVGFQIYPHKFRHTFCSRLVRKGVDLTTVSRLAGHQSIRTTSQFYVSSSRKEKMEAVNLL